MANLEVGITGHFQVRSNPQSLHPEAASRVGRQAALACRDAVPLGQYFSREELDHVVERHIKWVCESPNILRLADCSLLENHIEDRVCLLVARDRGEVGIPRGCFRIVDGEETPW